MVDHSRQFSLILVPPPDRREHLISHPALPRKLTMSRARASKRLFSTLARQAEFNVTGGTASGHALLGARTTTVQLTGGAASSVSPPPAHLHSGRLLSPQIFALGRFQMIVGVRTTISSTCPRLPAPSEELALRRARRRRPARRRPQTSPPHAAPPPPPPPPRAGREQVRALPLRAHHVHGPPQLLHLQPRRAAGGAARIC